MDWYQTTFVETGRSPALWALVGFLVAFAVVRTITRRIHTRGARDSAPDAAAGGPVKNVYIAGVHVHHQVWGILLVLVSGLLMFRFLPEGLAVDLLALAFGVGAALTLDEFALWFHLDDVYWSEEGRKSIDAILVGAALGVALLLGTSPIGTTSANDMSGWISSVVVLTHMVFAFVCILKGKLATGIIGVVVPLVAYVGAVRLAKPRSRWAQRRYGEKRLARACERFGARYEQRHDRLRDLLGGPAEGR